MSFEIHHGSALAVLRAMPSESVHCCVTSPPYWGLRDYGSEGQIGLEPTPQAYTAALVEIFAEVRRVLRYDGTLWLNLGDSYARDAAKGQHKPGDAGKQNYLIERAGGRAASTYNFRSETQGSSDGAVGRGDRAAVRNGCSGIKPKDLIGIPWRVAFALQENGWYLRSDIIWSKPNPMPESVTDRPTKSHEYLFLLAKSERYYYDADSIGEPTVSDHGSGNGFKREARLSYLDDDGPRGNDKPWKPNGKHAKTDPNAPGRRMVENVARARAEGAEHDSPFGGTRNRRSVWTINTQPFPEAHFATFPEDLVRPCILAGCPPRGKRCDCDQPILTPIGEGETEDPTMTTGRAGMNRERREVEGRRIITRREQREYARQLRESPNRDEMATAAGEAFAHYIRTDDSGARPIRPALLEDWMNRGWLTPPGACDHAEEPAGTVLDPFCGSGTTLLVAEKLGCHGVGIELNPEYIKIAERRLAQPMLNL